MDNSAAKILLDKQNVLIAGGSGLIGSRLSKIMTNNGYIVSHLSRDTSKSRYPSFYWDIKERKIDEKAIQRADVIIHLAGAGVADNRWSERRKKEIYDSRINSTRLLFDTVKRCNPGLKQFISASAIGYYGWDTGSKELDESCSKGEGFLADVVADWEKEVVRFSELNIKNAIVRVGMVLSMEGGVLAKMVKPTKIGLGAPLGSGRQYLSWIHIDDICGIFRYIMEKNKSDIFNGVAPGPVTNRVFTVALAKKLGRPLFLPGIPSFILKCMVGEMTVMLTGGNKVSSKKIGGSGYMFQYSSLDSAFNDLIR